MSADSVSILNELIQITKDSEEGFRTAAENVKEPSLKQLFLEKAESCNSAITDLQRKVKEIGSRPAESGSLLGAMHRVWVSIKGTLTGQDDLAILRECERGEDAIKAAYAKALKSNLSEEIRPLIQKQYDGVIKDHDTIRDLRDKYANAQ
ncbi:PA2169 family four-helix-bundle protein [Candidatus Odyssella acanthamoebae]|uniref:Aldehyde dehydrogenase n=1 Tax=Candidatus Odyssella acanthamoebae TaxID=91604 RepID=A0A077B072_9PROT|nr:PA2169 family four-helix-bundle protein [Candidatus Paracaedibacter acanthamoebae]AIK96350.1 aldehyde dehydrogenase [Candidatus Paracaedibacter acanthamoebae]